MITKHIKTEWKSDGKVRNILKDKSNRNNVTDIAMWIVDNFQISDNFQPETSPLTGTTSKYTKRKLTNKLK